jgi:hypothetical protein
MPFTLTYKAVWFFDAIMINCELSQRGSHCFAHLFAVPGGVFYTRTQGDQSILKAQLWEKGGNVWRQVLTCTGTYSHRFGFPYSTLQILRLIGLSGSRSQRKSHFPSVEQCEQHDVRPGEWGCEQWPLNEQYKMVEKSVNKQRDRAYIGRSRYCTCRLRQRT